MATPRTRQELQAMFATGMRPTGADFEDLFASWPAQMWIGMASSRVLGAGTITMAGRFIWPATPNEVAVLFAGEPGGSDAAIYLGDDTAAMYYEATAVRGTQTTPMTCLAIPTPGQQMIIYIDQQTPNSVRVDGLMLQL